MSGAVAAAAPATVVPLLPYPGLRPFGADEAAVYFGRTAQVQDLCRKLFRSRFLAVVGGSGSGKSSLLAAGLLPLLAEDRADADDPGWTVITLRPGPHPVDRLARALLQNAPPDSDTINRVAAAIRLSPGALAKEAVRLSGRSSQVLLLVDQFEELFRYASPDSGPAHRDEARRFVEAVLDASKWLHVMVSMRSDFIGDCAGFPGLAEAVSGSQFLVPRLSRGQIKAAIIGPLLRVAGHPEADARDVGQLPAEAWKGLIEPALVEKLLNDTGDEPDQLPVLQHALMRCHSAAEGGCLTLGLYQVTLGGWAQVLSNHADAVMQECGPERAVTVERVFRALVDEDRNRPVRRPRPMKRLIEETGLAEDEVRAVVTRFAKADCSFLVPPAPPEEIVDIGHEALIRNWGTLRGWLDAELGEGESFRLLRRLERDRAPASPALLQWWEVRRPGVDWVARWSKQPDADHRLVLKHVEWTRNEEQKRENEAQKRKEEARLQARREAQSVRAIKVLRWSALLLVLAGSLVAGVGWFMTWQARGDAERQLTRANAALFWNNTDTTPGFLKPEEVAALWTLTGMNGHERAEVFRRLQAGGITDSKLVARLPFLVRALGFSRRPNEINDITVSFQRGFIVPENQMAALAAAKALQSVLDAGQSAKLLDELLTAIRATNEAYRRQALGQAVAALNPEPKQAAALLDLLLTAMRETIDTTQPKQFGETGAKLADLVEPDKVEALLSKLLNIISKTANSEQRRELEKIGKALAARLDPQQAATLRQHVLVGMRVARDAHELGAFVQVGTILHPDSAQAVELLERLIQVMRATNDPDRLSTFGETGAALAALIKPGDAVALRIKLLHAMNDTADPSQLDALGQTGIKLNPTPAEKAELRRRLLDAMRVTINFSLRSTLGQAVAELGPNRTQTTMLLDALFPITGATSKPSQPRMVDQPVALLKLDPLQVAAHLDKLLTAMRETDNLYVRSVFGQTGLALTPDPPTARKFLDALLTPMSTPPDPFHLAVLGQTVAAFQPNSAEAAGLLKTLLYVMLLPNTDLRQVSTLGEAGAVLAALVKPEDQTALVKLLLDAMSTPRSPTAPIRPDQIGVLGQIGEALDPKAAEAAALFDGLLAAWPDITDPDRLQAFALTGVALAARLNSEQAKDRMSRLRSTFAFSRGQQDSEALARILAASAGLSVEDLVELLKYPTAAGPATAVLLEAIRKASGGAAPGAAEGLPTMLRWIGQQPKYQSLLGTPPVCPPPPPGFRCTVLEASDR